MDRKQLEQFAIDGDIQLQYQLGMMYSDEKNYDKAIYFLSMACENNHTEAMNSLAIIYFMTESVEKQREGIGLLKKAIALGDSFACGNLGLAYQKGVGVEQNAEKSFEYFLKAAQLNNAEAMDVISDYYKEGYGVEQNPEESEKWHMNAENQRKTDAVFQEIEELSQKGNRLMEQEKYSEARECFFSALALNTEPDGETALWINAAIGDSYYQEQQYEEAGAYFLDSYYANGGEFNPYICMMNGICMYKQKEFKRAETFLKNAYALGGKEVFEGEDSVYLKIAME